MHVYHFCGLFLTPSGSQSYLDGLIDISPDNLKASDDSYAVIKRSILDASGNRIPTRKFVLLSLTRVSSPPDPSSTR